VYTLICMHPSPTEFYTLSLHDALPICPAVHLGEVLPAELHNIAVDIDHHRPREGTVLQGLPEGRSLPAPDHQGALGRPVGGEHPRVDQGLVVDELVSLAGLDPSVEHQELAVRGRLHDLDVLELGLRLHDRPLDGVHVPFDGRRGLEEPLVRLRVGQLTPTVTLLTMGTREFRNIPRCISTIDVRSAANCSTK